MTTQIKRDRESSFRTILIATLLYSILFLGLIGYGYYLLFAHIPTLGIFLGFVLAVLAWSIARFLGNEEGGIRRYAPLFVFMLLISALGIFNNLMLTFEGKKIFAESINNAEEQFNQLGKLVTTTPEKIKAVEAKWRAVYDALGNLDREIRNRANCGQGPEAQKRIEELKQVLPGFRALTRSSSDMCSRLDDLALAYRESVKTLIEGLPWYIESEFAAWCGDFQKLTGLYCMERQPLGGDVGSIAKARSALAEIRTEAVGSNGARLITQIKPKLEDLDAQYRQSLAIASKYYDTRSLPRELDLLSVRSVGEWSQLINLIFDRANKATTYLYPALAVFIDWLMVYLFRLVRARRVRTPNSTNTDDSPSILRG